MIGSRTIDPSCMHLSRTDLSRTDHPRTDHQEQTPT